MKLSPHCGTLRCLGLISTMRAFLEHSTDVLLKMVPSVLLLTLSALSFSPFHSVLDSATSTVLRLLRSSMNASIASCSCHTWIPKDEKALLIDGWIDTLYKHHLTSSHVAPVADFQYMADLWNRDPRSRGTLSVTSAGTLTMTSSEPLDSYAGRDGSGHI